MERLMNAGLTTHDLPDEYFVLQIDGRVKSGHRRFADALRAALLLRDQFPQQESAGDAGSAQRERGALAKSASGGPVDAHTVAGAIRFQLWHDADVPQYSLLTRS